MSSLYDKENERLLKEVEDRVKGVADSISLRDVIVVDASQDRPKPNWRYVYQMKKILEWPRCEDRETTIGLFKDLWPEVADKAEAFYDTAAADPRSAEDILDTFGFGGRREAA